MKRILTVCAVILLYAESGYTQSSDRVEGIWFSIDEKTGEVTGNWDLYVLGSALYGKPIVGHPQQ
jgi:hypothetical protein